MNNEKKRLRNGPVKNEGKIYHTTDDQSINYMKYSRPMQCICKTIQNVTTPKSFNCTAKNSFHKESTD